MTRHRAPERAPRDRSWDELAASLAPAVLDEIVEESRAEAASILREKLTGALIEEVQRLAVSRYSSDMPPEVCDVRSGAASESRGGAGWYVYGVSWSKAHLPVLEGVDGGCIQRVVVDDLAAVASAIEPRSPWGLGPDGDIDLEALAPRAQEHARVLESMLENGAVLPFRFGVMYPGLTEVKRFLRENCVALRETLHRVEGQSEWGLVIALESSPAAERVVEPDAGRDYLVRRLQERAVKEDAGRRARRAALCVHDELALMASDSVVHPVSTVGGKRPENRCPLLKASYLVPADQVEDFRRAAESALTRAGGDLGLMGDLTGPWPPYNFSEFVKDPVA